MNEAEKIIAELKKLDGRIQQAIEKILGKNPNRQQLLAFINSQEFNKMLNDLGLNKIIENYVKGFDASLVATGFSTVNLTAERIAIINANLDLIKNTYGRTILGYYNLHTDLLKSKLTASIIEGVKAKDIIKELAAETPLTTPQAQSVVSTSYADYARVGVAKAYEDKPEQRFFYFEGLDVEAPTKSDECKWLLLNQKKEGYTRAEIDAGIETPFTHQYGDLAGQTKKIYWFGRFPNYNCYDRWMPIEVKNG